MKILLNILLLFIPFLGFSQDSRKLSAEEYVLSKIGEIENHLMGKSSMNVKLPNGIVCLTGIAPKQVDGTYVGIVYWPTLEDIELWRKWVKEHHGKFSYDSKRIDNDDLEKINVEYEKGKFRSNYCK
jgi:hypothetical protein